MNFSEASRDPPRRNGPGFQDPECARQGTLRNRPFVNDNAFINHKFRLKERGILTVCKKVPSRRKPFHPVFSGLDAQRRPLDSLTQSAR
jgi:hypothetical protein